MSRTATARRPRRIGAPLVCAAVCLVPMACGGGDSGAAGAPVTVADDAVADDADPDEVDAPDAAAPSFGLVTPGEAAALAADPAVTVLDVRTPDEFADGHLEGATLIDFYSDTFADRLAELDPDATYLVYCRSGNRSGQTTAMMAELGIEQVYDLDGGVIAWSAQGGQLVR